METFSSLRGYRSVLQILAWIVLIVGGIGAVLGANVINPFTGRTEFNIGILIASGIGVALSAFTLFIVGDLLGMLLNINDNLAAMKQNAAESLAVQKQIVKLLSTPDAANTQQFEMNAAQIASRTTSKETSAVAHSGINAKTLRVTVPVFELRKSPASNNMALDSNKQPIRVFEGEVLTTVSSSLGNEWYRIRHNDAPQT